MTTPMEDGGFAGAPGRRAPPPMPPAVRRIAIVSVVLFWVVLALLLAVQRLPLLDGILLAVLLVAVPGFSTAQLPLIELVPLERVQAYWSSIMTLWLLGTASWFVGTREGGAAAVGLVAIAWGPGILWTVGLALLGLLTIVLFRQVAIWLGSEESLLLRQLLPRTLEERRIFGVLSVAAGFGEEIAYRGYSLSMLSPVLGVPGAAVATSVVFGVLHGYQGLLGIVRTCVMGGMLAWGFLASGSLWPPIVAHALIDLAAGLWLGERLMSPRQTTGVEA
jgi:membrane protease YdiL (CAAX protease family)